jgi:small subunit ribosomal protein S1
MSSKEPSATLPIISDLSWTEHIEHPADRYKRGAAVEAVILNIDKDSKKVSLGIKQLSEDPWKSIESEYPVGQIITGEISKITNFGAFVKLPTGIEGLVHISEYADRGADRLEDILKVGEKHQFRVVNVNKDEHKLGLSPKLEGEVRSAQDRANKGAGAKAQKKAPKEAMSSGVKTKSAFQMALEEHSARQENENKKD